MEEVNIIDPQTGRTLSTTRKAWQKYYQSQGYVEDTDEVVLAPAAADGEWSEFFAADDDNAAALKAPKRPLTGAAKAAAERKARQAQPS